VLFDSQWIVRKSNAAQPETKTLRWDVVRDTGGLAAWARAWRGNGGPNDIFRPDLLGQDAVTIVAGHVADRVMAGAVLYRTKSVVGVSNFFAHRDVAGTSWSGCLALAHTLFPDATFVGYESGDALAVARLHGFEPVGPLRVWVFTA
jgi:hypothetical protein